jgi:hypothetical protein
LSEEIKGRYLHSQTTRTAGLERLKAGKELIECVRRVGTNDLKNLEIFFKNLLLEKKLQLPLQPGSEGTEKRQK